MALKSCFSIDELVKLRTTSRIKKDWTLRIDVFSFNEQEFNELNKFI